MWEFNLCVEEYNLMQSENTKNAVTQAWRTANFTGAAVHGSLKDLSEYIGESTKQAPKISYDEFDRKLAEMKGAGSDVNV